MIVPIIGALGTGKTTICRELTQRFGTPHFEMSWMPEFMRKNGQAIAYADDEQIAVEALVAVAKTYRAAGHQVVLISDFRNEVLPLVLTHLAGRRYQIVRFYCSVEALLVQRVLDPMRASGYRDVPAAQKANRAIQTMDFENCLDIDVAVNKVESVVEIIKQEILVPNQAI